MDLQFITIFFNNNIAIFLTAITGSIIGGFLGAKMALRSRTRKNRPSRFSKIKKWLTYRVDVVN
ncbi:hypothetical protein ICV01_03500 [Polynucleobacter sp. MWH-Spelu-300-X4]|uniref:hypothetical protein n=1 Tax=Polynucleobacter sp. MWH-Spelu-300-X4 TaxID=2689109 RepID=UPI001BFE51BE|nr:hypothetical protein [Polynucleobacter sp. MWH-Spelu-300-X4]QWD80391.1 hypothetical protein ICV01_03500 [Polynucleobacter sp. MWH-Spelu-300-X4]